MTYASATVAIDVDAHVTLEETALGIAVLYVEHPAGKTLATLYFASGSAGDEPTRIKAQLAAIDMLARPLATLSGRLRLRLDQLDKQLLGLEQSPEPLSGDDEGDQQT